MIQIKTRNIVIGIFVLLVAIFILGGYFGHRIANRASNAVIIALNDTIHNYEYKIGELKRYASERNQLIVEQEQAIHQGLLDKKELKALHLSAVSEVTRLKAQVKMLIDSIGHNGVITIPCPNNDTLQFLNAIYLPFEFQKEDDFVDLKGRFDSEGKMSVDLTVPVTLDIWTGYDKTRKSYKATVVSNNPFFKVSDINSIKVEAKKPSRFSIGLHIGYGFTIKDQVYATPYAGGGISYAIVRF